MPRVTRRSVASKEESTPEESRPATNSRKRGSKKEPAPEEVGEPQGTPKKRGGRQAAKEPEAEVSGRGRGASRGKTRGGRGKKEAEPESEEEAAESEPEEEDSTPRGSAASKKKVGRGGIASSGSRSTGRAGQKSKAAEEVEDKAEEEDEKADESTYVAVKSKGKGAKGKASSVTPSPQSGRRGRGKATAVDENEVDDNESNNVENEVDVTPKGRQRNAQNKEAKSTTPTSGSRRGRGQKTETTPKAPPASGRSSKRGSGASTSAQTEKQEEEPMDTADGAAPSNTESIRGEQSASTVIEKVVTGEPTDPSSSKKRKLEDDLDEHAVKRLRTSGAEKMEDDFVVVSADDVPAHDSQEVADSLPPPVQDKASVPTTPEDTEIEGPRVYPLMAAPGIPAIVPLTEAELAKQYSSQNRDKDETSSMLVEVGSECASDVTGLSSRGLDISDVVSLDSMDQTIGEGFTESTKDPNSPSSPRVFQQQCSAPDADNANLLQNSSLNASVVVTHSAKADLSASTPSDVSQCPEILEVHTEPAHLPNTPQVPSHNGTVEVLDSSHLSSKQEQTVTEPYVPSSTAIDNRKFRSNPGFPLELMDPAFCFSVVSYNILADCHMHRSDYSYTQGQYLDQEYRHSLLLKELDYLDGDILCLQEVNPDYYTKTLLPAMKSRGYDGFFVKRTKDYWNEGEATFVRTSKFEIISNQSLSLGELAFREVDDSAATEEVKRAAKKYLDRADVILLSELRCKKTGKVIIVCNIHVVYDLKAPDVQCTQVACAIKQLVAKAGNDQSPHILCGDFNSEVTSPGYQLAKDGYLSDGHIHKLQALQNLDLDGSSKAALINHLWGAFQHTSSNLKSAYELTLGKEPPITSLTKNTHATLDYIFHSTSSVDTVGVLETLDLQAVDATGGLPSADIPSDHLSLKAVFRLK